MSLLDKIPIKSILEWSSFLREEIRNTIKKYNNSSTLGPNHVSWRYLKIILDKNKCLSSTVNIANTCINLSYWPIYFKKSTLIIILKSNKVSYNLPKMFEPIVLLNTLRKLIKQVIGKRLQN